MVARGKKILIPCLLLYISSGYMNPPKYKLFHYENLTSQAQGQKQERRIHWPSLAEPVPIEKEIRLLMSGNLVRKGEFGPLSGSRELEVELESAELGLTFQQALSIRKQLLVSKLMKDGISKLKNEQTVKKLTREFERNQRSLLELSFKYDLPPVTILRSILASRVPQFSCLDRNRPVGRVLQSIISEVKYEHVKSYLCEWEFKELQTAKENDIVGYSGNSLDSAPQEWETTIFDYLDEHGIKYMNEETLKLYGLEEKGTPDCLLLDELYINGKHVRWIECKSFYASGLRENSYFTRKAVSRQVDRYEKEFGRCGAVILKNGFSSTVCLKHPSTLFLDSGPLLRSENAYSL